MAVEVEAVRVPRLVRVGSRGTPGYGGVFEPDLPSMMPLEQGSLDSLEAEP